MGLGAIYFLMAVSGQPDMFIAFLIFGGGGVAVYLYARKTKIKGDHYRKYIAMVVNSNQRSIDIIANAAGVPYNVAVNDLQNMINDGYFSGAYIDVQQRQIVIPQFQQPQPYQAPPVQSPVQSQPVVISCPGCGANSRLFPGQWVACEYCDTILQ